MEEKGEVRESEKLQTSETASSPHISSPNYLKNWINAPVFVFRGRFTSRLRRKKRKYAARKSNPYRFLSEMVHTNVNRNKFPFMVCPYEQPCPFLKYCNGLHYIKCRSCLEYCMHPTDLKLQSEHLKHCVQEKMINTEISGIPRVINFEWSF